MPTDFALNCSVALVDTPPRQRAARAQELGFGAVEFWWPFATQSPEHSEVDEFVENVMRADVETVLLNFPGGAAAVGDRGLLCVPGREDDFVASARAALDIGRRLSVQFYNPMAGNTVTEWTPQSREFETAVRNLVAIDSMLADAGATIVLEPLSGFPHAALTTYDDTRVLVRTARAAGAQNVAMLFDLYHLAVNGDPVLDPWAADIAIIGHVQIADAPGRGWPGTGDLPLGAWVQKLRDAGYAGRIGLECAGEPGTAAAAVADVARSRAPSARPRAR
ncbi:MAG: TIM barrel protein [Salinibacterium sp.]|nr:TIM barrel protein [Salinibacterium sp.]